jgi:NADH-quinone oxidoreductase subunit J
MSGHDIAFYIFSFFTLLCGALVITKRNPIGSALCLVLTISSLAGLFVLLRAFFLAAVQILVYAGAVMVLFLFVIMLLDLGEEVRRKINKLRFAAGVVAVLAVLAIVVNVIWSAAPGGGLAAPAVIGATRALGLTLFQKFLLPFEILSLLLLVAMLGVILLSKKDLK